MSEGEIGVLCAVDECDERIVGLEDGWDLGRGTTCQDCIDYHDRHGHWPDESAEICAECRIDDGMVPHDCEESFADRVLLKPGSECDNCGFEAPITDGGIDQLQDGTERCDSCGDQSDKTTVLYRDGHVWATLCIDCHDTLAEVVAKPRERKQAVTDGGTVEECTEQPLSPLIERMNRYRQAVKDAKEIHDWVGEIEQDIRTLRWMAAGGLGSASRERVTEKIDAQIANLQALRDRVEDLEDPRELGEEARSLQPDTDRSGGGE